MAQDSIWIFITGNFYAWNFITATMKNGYRDYIGKIWKEFGDIHKIITRGYKILDANIYVYFVDHPSY